MSEAKQRALTLSDGSGYFKPKRIRLLSPPTPAGPSSVRVPKALAR